MEQETFEIAADSLQAAREQARARIPHGLHLLSERVLSDGKPVTITETADKTENALAAARAGIPARAHVVAETVVQSPELMTLRFSAENEDSARQQAESKTDKTSVIQAVSLAIPGKKGFLGIGRTPGHYDTRILKRAVVDVTYRMDARIEVTAGDIQQRLWDAEGSSPMRSLITSMTEKDLIDLVGAIAFADFPLNALASPGGSLDKRSTLAAHFTLQLVKAGKVPQANQLLNKILDKMRAKLATGAREGGVVPQGREDAFESAFVIGDMGSAAEILKANRSTDFWRIDEMLKRELYDLSMELLKKDRPREAALLLDAVMLDYPADLETEFWRAAAYHNIFNNDKSNKESRQNAARAVAAFLAKAGKNPQFAKQCSDLRRLSSEY